jgi:aspartate/methionine/tyrosine aminotransferase
LSELKDQRDYLTERLTEGGFKLLPAEGTYFLNIDLRASGIAGSGLDFAYGLVRHHGLATIPLQAFCETGRDLPVLRLCFAKARESLDAGIAALHAARS